MTQPLRSIRACVFDAYGTLFDFGTAAAACADVLGDRTVALTSLWRDKQLQYSWLRGLQGRYAPFRQVTEEALDFAAPCIESAPFLLCAIIEIVVAASYIPPSMVENRTHVLGWKAEAGKARCHGASKIVW